jgi:hypothetical protein
VDDAVEIRAIRGLAQRVRVGEIRLAEVEPLAERVA